MNGLFPLREATPMTARSQGRTIARAIVREPTSLRTGRALTAASHRKRGRQGEQTGEVRWRGLLDAGKCGASRELRLTVRFIWNGGIHNMKKLIYFIVPAILLAAAGFLLACKRHASRTGLACIHPSDL